MLRPTKQLTQKIAVCNNALIFHETQNNLERIVIKKMLERSNNSPCPEVKSPLYFFITIMTSGHKVEDKGFQDVNGGEQQHTWLWSRCFLARQYPCRASPPRRRHTIGVTHVLNRTKQRSNPPKDFVQYICIDSLDSHQ